MAVFFAVTYLRGRPSRQEPDGDTVRLRVINRAIGAAADCGGQQHSALPVQPLHKI